MKSDRPCVNCFIASAVVFVVSLLNACSSSAPTPINIPTELPKTIEPSLSPTTRDAFVPVVGEQQSTFVIHTPYLTPTRPRTTSQTPVPSETPTPTEIPTPSSTPLPPIVWGAGIPQPYIFDQYEGHWLSSGHKMIGNYFGPPDFGTVSLISAPSFALETVQAGPDPVLGSVFTTSPNGRWILFGSVPKQDYDPSWNEVSQPIRVTAQDSRSLSIFPDQGSLRWLSFLGWLDGNTVALSDYAGGGFYNYSIMDSANNSLLAQVQVHGPAWPPNPIYLPIAEEYGGSYQLLVLSRFAQANPYSTLLGPNNFSRGFPKEYIAPDMSTIFKDWLPDSNRMLVQAFVFSRNINSTSFSQLMLWHVDSGIVQILIPAAIDGMFSPDGKLLAFVTLGAAPLTADGQPSFDLGPQVPQISQTYLQLMEMNTLKVLFSLPAVTTLNRSANYTVDVFDTPLKFSPDSRYMAFVTPGILIADQSGKLVVLPVSQESAPYLSVVDLISFQPLLSTPLGAIQDFYFSPANDRLAFLGKEGNWYLLKLPTSQVQTVVMDGGNRLRWNGWSYDGFYFSFFELNPNDPDRTMIIGPMP
jgi:hypothetical protein